MTIEGATIDVGGWLRGLGLGQYEATFRENEINEKVLPNLTAEDLKDLGVNVLGHRRMLLDSITALRCGSNAKVPASQHVLHEGALALDPGRRAETPWQIPWNGWKDILWRTYKQVGEHRLFAVAAGVVFYGLLAVFPALTALVSVSLPRRLGLSVRRCCPGILRALPTTTPLTALLAPVLV